MNERRYVLEIRPLTGVSVTTGDLLDNASYFFNDDYCVVADVDKIISRIMTEGTDKQKVKLTNILDTGIDIQKRMRRFILDNYQENDVRYMTLATAMAKEKIDGNQNVYEIFRENINGEYLPVLPGSSLKGAIRTAFMSEAINRNDYIKDRAIEKSSIKDRVRVINKVLNPRKFDEDTIRKETMGNIQISDAMPDCVKTSLVSLNLFSASQKGRMKKALPMVDTILGCLLGKDSTFKSIVKIRDVTDIKYYLNAKNLINSCNAFSKRVFNEEAKVFINNYKDDPNNYGTFDVYDKLASIINGERKEGEFLIKLGRFSQREYMTYGDETRIMLGSKKRPVPINPLNPKWGVTRTLIEYDGQYVPMGWCLCTLNEIK